MMDYRELVKKTGTPSFVFYDGEFKKRLAAVREILNNGAAESEKIKVCYAAKANPFLLPAAAEAADRLEICSQGEMDIVHTLGICGEKVLYSGVSKTATDIRRAIAQGMRHATAESLRHVTLLQQEAAAAGVTLTVILRLNSGAQFGMSESDIRNALAERESYPNLTFTGIHFFKGTMRKKLKQQEEELQMLEDFLGKLREDFSMELPELEYGPGLPVPYFEGEDFTDTLAPLRELMPALRRAAGFAELTVEMGRFYAAPCGTYFTAVTDRKDTDSAAIAILDGGIHQLTYAGQMMGMKIPRLSVVEPSEGEPEHVMLCGSLCTTGDVLVRDAVLPPLSEGDVLAFENVGAYTVTEGIGLFLSHDLPAIYLYDRERGENALRIARTSMPSSVINTPGAGMQ